MHPLPGPLPLSLTSGSSGHDFFVDKWSLTCVLFFDFHAKMLAKYPLASTCLQLQKLEKDPRKREYFSTSQRLHNEVYSFLKYHLCFCIPAFSHFSVTVSWILTFSSRKDWCTKIIYRVVRQLFKKNFNRKIRKPAGNLRGRFPEVSRGFRIIYHWQTTR